MCKEHISRGKQHVNTESHISFDVKDAGKENST